MKLQFLLSLWLIQVYGSQNHCCGGILNADYGELRHPVNSGQQQHCPENCIWTIQTTNPAAMRVKLHHLVSNAPLLLYTEHMLATGNALRLSTADINSSFDLSGGPLIVALSDTNAQLTLTWKSFHSTDNPSVYAPQPTPQKAIDPVPQTILFASQDNGVKSISAATSNVTAISSDVSAYGVAYDSDYDEIYWSDFNGVYRAGPTGKEEIISAVEDGVVYGIALDEITGNLYLCNHSGDGISLCSRTGSDWICAAIVTRQVSAPVGIVLHSSKGVMYWTNRLDYVGIMRAGMDGSRVTPIITGLIAPAGLAIDLSRERLYWTDTSTNRIEFSDLNGQNRGVFLTLKSDSGPFGISVLGDKLFWSNYRDGSIQQTTLTGTDIVKLYDGSSALFHIEVIGSRNKEDSMRVTNRCKGRCSHMCALAFKSSKCICPEGMMLTADQSTCNFQY